MNFFTFILYTISKYEEVFNFKICKYFWSYLSVLDTRYNTGGEWVFLRSLIGKKKTIKIKSHHFIANIIIIYSANCSE